MRVAVVGGGPAGLTIAALLRGHGIAEEVVLWERERLRDAGFGVLLSPNAVSALGRLGTAVAESAAAASVRVRRITVRRDDEQWSRPAGLELTAIARSTLNRFLWRASEGAGVYLRIREAPALEALARVYDLVICTDGAGSVASTNFLSGSDTVIGPPFAWLGLDRATEGMEFITRRTPQGTFTAHVYPYSATASTFLLEGRAELDLDQVTEIFGTGIRCAPGQDSLAWRRFHDKTLDVWSRDNVVVVGDAAHTAHYSVGSGTTLALEDAVALHDALSAEGVLRTALKRYESERRPAVEETQSRGRLSAEWFTRVEEYAELPMTDFATSLLTRGGRLGGPTARQRPAPSAPTGNASHTAAGRHPKVR